MLCSKSYNTVTTEICPNKHLIATTQANYVLPSTLEVEFSRNMQMQSAHCNQINKEKGLTQQLENKWLSNELQWLVVYGKQFTMGGRCGPNGTSGGRPPGWKNPGRSGTGGNIDCCGGQRGQFINAPS